ncbi:hypothetical protein D9615_007727 [Tricholomella constricta]|uniref:Protein YAE1 n=1 Tax=Tricholomella constricta TaxID=117010 RepID=A0A8H5LZS0_9AGAR|nr:hypothetical protein D9615_007727 [Tricholomella constricta]
MDTPWDEGRDTDTAWKDVREAEWAKMSNEFTNVGYREGITAGKEAAVQEGFDRGFEDVGAPLGRDIGLIRGRSSAILSFLISTSPTALNVADDEKEVLVLEAREIVSQLGNIRYSDIEPRDLEAEQHAREHLETEGQEMEVNEDLEKKKQMEGVEDMLAKMSAGENVEGPGRPTVEDVVKLKARLRALSSRLGFGIDNC